MALCSSRGLGNGLLFILKHWCKKSVHSNARGLNLNVGNPNLLSAVYHLDGRERLTGHSYPPPAQTERVLQAIGAGGEEPDSPGLVIQHVLIYFLIGFQASNGCLWAYTAGVSLRRLGAEFKAEILLLLQICCLSEIHLCSFSSWISLSVQPTMQGSCEAWLVLWAFEGRAEFKCNKKTQQQWYDHVQNWHEMWGGCICQPFWRSLHSG